MFNRVHALPLPHRVINVLGKVHVLILVAGPMAAIWWCLDGHGRHVNLADLLTVKP